VKVPTGFSFAGGSAGIKLKRPDLALILSEEPAIAAGCFTQSKSRAACVDWNARHLPRDDARAIVTNSGNANCFTGPAGELANRRMAEIVAEGLGVEPHQVLTCSTGVIGVPLPIGKIEAAVPDLIERLGPNPMPAAEAILTTDTTAKVFSREIFLGGDRVRVLGIGKGSGMIHPNMATTLGYILTDANVTAEVLDEILREAVADTFNMISVDRDTSTNDAVIALANGMAENELVEREDVFERKHLAAAITDVCRDIARAVAADGEGARHLLTVHVTRAAKRKAARALARSVVESTLTKAAFFGTDPNWGRIAAALGARAAEEGHAFEQAELTIRLQGVAVLVRGVPAHFDTDGLRALLRSDEVTISIDLGLGDHEATAWGCDLSYDYVRINADYSAILVDPNGVVGRDRRIETKTPELKAEILLQALRYIERFSGTRAVVKFGGASMMKPELKERFAEDVRLLQAVGLQPILVHGGGAEISRTLEAMGKTSEYEDGLRVTDEATLEVVEMVLTGSVNKEIVSALARAGAKAVGISGKDGDLLSAKKREVPSGRDLGFVGEVTRVDPGLLELLMSKGYIPVVSPVGLGADGHTYNIDADTVAAEIAIACGATKLLYLTDAPGIQAQGLLISELSGEELEARMVDGTVPPAMLPKAQAALRALEGGVETVHVIDGRVPHNIVAELFTSRGVGTMVRAGAPPEGEQLRD
jgi:acetylglutamate kinase